MGAREPVPIDRRLLLNAAEAADLLGLTRDAFQRDIAPEVRGVLVRSSWRYPRKEIDRWLEEHARAMSVDELRQLEAAHDLPPADPLPRVPRADERLLLTSGEASALLGVSRDVFREDIAPMLRAVTVRPKMRRFSRAELEKWIGRREGI